MSELPPRRDVPREGGERRAGQAVSAVGPDVRPGGTAEPWVPRGVVSKGMPLPRGLERDTGTSKSAVDGAASDSSVNASNRVALGEMARGQEGMMLDNQVVPGAVDKKGNPIPYTKIRIDRKTYYVKSNVLYDTPAGHAGEEVGGQVAQGDDVSAGEAKGRPGLTAAGEQGTAGTTAFGEMPPTGRFPGETRAARRAARDAWVAGETAAAEAAGLVAFFSVGSDGPAQPDKPSEPRAVDNSPTRTPTEVKPATGHAAHPLELNEDALAALSPRQRLMVEMAARGVPHSVIAQELGVSTNGMRYKLRDADVAYRKALEKQNG